MTLTEKADSPRFAELVDEVKRCCMDSMVPPRVVARGILENRDDDVTPDDRALMLYAVIAAQDDALAGMASLLADATALVFELRVALGEEIKEGGEVN